MESNNCKVSIITVSYNSSKTIEQTIKSVLHQTYKNIEYIIIDGLSTDGTQQIVEKYMDSIDYFVSEKDEGLYYAMNKGIKKATGDIIGIINSDDWYALDAVENVVNFFEENEVELSYGKTVIINESGGERLSGETKPLTTIWCEIPFMHPSVFVKKNIYAKYGLFDVKYKLASDCDLILRLYSQNVKFGYINKAIAYFREGGLSTRKRKKSIDEAHSIFLRYSELAPDKKRTIHNIEERYARDCFTIEIVENNKILHDLLCKYFDRKMKEIIIFGTGVWGKRCYQVLEKSNVEVVYFVDNNSQKWDTDFCGIKILNPNKLQAIEGDVLIAVMDAGDEVKNQLERMKNDKLKYVSIRDFVELFYNRKEVYGEEKAENMQYVSACSDREKL